MNKFSVWPTPGGSIGWLIWGLFWVFEGKKGFENGSVLVRKIKCK